MWGAEQRKVQAEFLQKYAGNYAAKDAMIRPVLLKEKDSAATVLKKLRKESVYSCFVVSDEKKLLGIISDDDIIALFMNQVKNEPLVQMLNREYRRKFRYKTAKDLAKKHLIAKKETPINEVIKMLTKTKNVYLPDVDDKERVVGAITPNSVIKLLEQH